MKYSDTTRGKESLAEFTQRRKRSIGGSDIASVMRVGRYSCALKLFKEKTGVPKDEDDSDRMEFRRGHRLESVAANYYAEKTGRDVFYTTPQTVPGKPHLSVTMDRLVFRKEDSDKKDPGYLEIKVVGRGSWIKIKRDGLIDDYILQLQYGMSVSGCNWGAYAIYAPDIDELLEWDVEKEEGLGEILLEKADDFWTLNIECGVEPDPLPDGSVQCETCPWSISCRGKSMAQSAAAVIVSRPDLEGIAAKYRELSGMGTEVSEAKESLREELLEAIGRKPGTYMAGKYRLDFTAVEQKRFDSKALQKADATLYEQYRKPSIVETLKVRE